MTVIAWDGKTLAADKLMCHGATKQTTTKIFRHGPELLAITGNLSIGLEVMEWYKAGAIDKDYPAGNRSENAGASLVIIKRQGTVVKYESSPIPFTVEGEFCAFGSGDESALVAMACGCDARKAVELTCRFNTGCGNGIDALTL